MDNNSKIFSTSDSSLLIRPFQEEDSARIANIWLNGLQQTADSQKYQWQRWLFTKLMKDYGERAVSEQGDVGPEGRNLWENWGRGTMYDTDFNNNNDDTVAVDKIPNDDTVSKTLSDHSLETRGKESRCKVMLVAVDKNQGAILGCCGVKRGTNEKVDLPTVTNDAKNDANNSNNVNNNSNNDDLDPATFSIWRLSVDGSSRRRGVGKSLMDTAEAWAKQHGGKRMQLVTGNPVASEFYVKKCGYEKRMYGMSWWHEKML